MFPKIQKKKNKKKALKNVILEEMRDCEDLQCMDEIAPILKQAFLWDGKCQREQRIKRESEEVYGKEGRE